MILQWFFKFFIRYRIPLVCVFISLWALQLRFERLEGRKLWNDEEYQIFQTAGPFKPVWQRHSYGDFTGYPGDYLLTYPFLKIYGESKNKWGLAIPHILATMAGFYFLYLVGRRFFKTTAGYCVAFLVMCFNDELVFHSFEFRPYAVLPTLSLMVFYFTDRIMNDYERLSSLKRVAIGIFLAITILFHQYGIAMVGFSALFFFAGKLHHANLKKEFLRYFKYYGIILLLTLPLWLWYLKPVLEVGGRVPFQYIPNPMIDTVGFLKSVFGNLIGFKKLYILLAGVVIAFILPHRERLRQIGFFVLLIALPIELILFSDLLGNYTFLQRQFIWVTPLFAILLGWCWDVLFSERKIFLR